MDTRWLIECKVVWIMCAKNERFFGEGKYLRQSIDLHASVEGLDLGVVKFYKSVIYVDSSTINTQITRWTESGCKMAD